MGEDWGEALFPSKPSIFHTKRSKWTWGKLPKTGLSPLGKSPKSGLSKPSERVKTTGRVSYSIKNKTIKVLSFILHKE
jgi:hypothetical protein